MTKVLHPYLTLQTSLADLISKTPAGEKLPTEPLLAKQLGVSRATLREAMRSFEGQGLIRRRQGIGTFVVGHPHVMQTGLEVLESIENIAEKIDLHVSMDDLRIQNFQANQDQAEVLGIKLGDEIVRISRVIRVDNRPIAFLVDTLPLDVLTPEDLKGEFTGSVLDFLIKRGDPQLAYSNTEIRVMAASSSVARELEIQRGDGLLLFVAVLYTKTGRAIDYSYSYFLPGYFRFQVVRSIGGN